MKLKSILFAALVYALGAPVAFAACPAYGAGPTADEIKANEQRILCLQQELAAQSDRQALQFQIDTLTRNMQHFELQQRFDALVFTAPAPPQFP